MSGSAPLVQIPGEDGPYWIDLYAAQRAQLPDDPQALCAWLNRLLGPKAQVAQVYKDEPQRSRVCAYQIDGRRWVVKRYRQPLWRSRMEMSVRMGAAWREWRGAWRLARAGMRVCQPVAIAHQPSHGEQATALVFAHVGEQTLHHLIASAKPRPQALAQWTGAQVGRLLAAGYVNRDHKAGNLMIDNAVLRGESEPTIIDTVAIRMRLSNASAIRMLATLYRTARRAGPVSPREALRALHAARAGDARLRAMPLKAQAARITALAGVSSSDAGTA